MSQEAEATDDGKTSISSTTHKVTIITTIPRVAEAPRAGKPGLDYPTWVSDNP